MHSRRFLVCSARSTYSKPTDRSGAILPPFLVAFKRPVGSGAKPPHGPRTDTLPGGGGLAHRPTQNILPKKKKKRKLTSKKGATSVARTVTITWTLTAEEHGVWLSQARLTGYSVGQYIYLLAALHLIDDYPMGRLPGTFVSLRQGLMLARWQRNWRQHGRKG